MESTSIKILVFIVSVANVLQLCKGLQFSVTPSNFTAALEDSVTISCSSDNSTDLSKRITVIELTKDGHPQLFIRQCLPVEFVTNKTERLQAVGDVKKDTGYAFLNVTLDRPTAQDSGIYTCAMNYLDENGESKRDEAAVNVASRRVDEDANELILLMYRDRLSQLEKKLDGLTLAQDTKKLEQELNAFQDESRTQFAEWKNSTQTTYGFSAQNSRTLNVITGGTIVFDTLDFSSGAGYDTTTGVYTIQETGVYAFHLTIKLECNSCTICIGIKSDNEDMLASLHTYSSSDSDQNTVSTIRHLPKGDKVRPVVTDLYPDRYALISAHGYSRFAAYFLG